VPRRVRPKFPAEWKVPNEPRRWITWKHADAKLRSETEYWVSTSSRDGKPHATPVWGIWKNEAFFFETDPESVKGRNLRTNPKIVVHVRDGLDTVIVEGAASKETDLRALKALASDYSRKYGYRPDWSDPLTQIVFRVAPRTVHAWKAPRMHRSLVKFIF